MKGSYWFRAKSKKVLFEFSIRRNITIIKGDSATGKTTCPMKEPTNKKTFSYYLNIKLIINTYLNYLLVNQPT